MEKLTIPPDEIGYSFNDAITVLSASLNGGMSKYRTDIIDPALKISVQWTLDREEYTYIRAFYKDNGKSTFLMDLLIEDAFQLTEQECRIVPGSFTLKSQSGHCFIVAAEIETNLSRILSPTIDNILIMLFGNDWQEYNDKFDKFINLDIPGDINL